VTLQVGIRFIINLAATSALDLPISAFLEKKEQVENRTYFVC